MPRFDFSPHQRIGIDTMLLVYLMEDEGTWGEKARSAFAEMEKKRIVPVCSTLVIAELLQQPLKKGDARLINEYQRILLTDSSIEFIPITVPVATRGAQIAARYGLKTPDALHLASALEGRATAFVTADKMLKRVQALDVILL